MRIVMNNLDMFKELMFSRLSTFLVNKIFFIVLLLLITKRICEAGVRVCRLILFSA